MKGYVCIIYIFYFKKPIKKILQISQRLIDLDINCDAWPSLNLLKSQLPNFLKTNVISPLLYNFYIDTETRKVVKEMND